jgi:hypothetical protein
VAASWACRPRIESLGLTHQDDHRRDQFGNGNMARPPVAAIK